LHIAAETLGPVLCRRSERELGLDTKQLGETLGTRRRSELLNLLIREAVFGGDSKLQELVRKASDAYEHGFMTFGEVYDLAAHVRDAAALCVRAALVRELLLPAESAAQCTGLPQREPAGLRPSRHRLTGTLVGAGNEHVAQDADPLILDWSVVLDDVRSETAGGTWIRHEHDLGSKHWPSGIAVADLRHGAG
jgi:hypothetical protein